MDLESKKHKPQKRKESKKESINVAFLKAWLLGIEDMNQPNWFPDEHQWRKIRDKIFSLEDVEYLTSPHNSNIINNGNSNGNINTVGTNTNVTPLSEEDLLASFPIPTHPLDKVGGVGYNISSLQEIPHNQNLSNDGYVTQFK